MCNRSKVICVSVLITTLSVFSKEKFSYNSVRFLNESYSHFLLSRAFSKILRDSLLALVTRGMVSSLDRYFGRLGQTLGTASDLKNFRFRIPRLFRNPFLAWNSLYPSFS